jgi:hypothetical protein
MIFLNNFFIKLFIVLDILLFDYLIKMYYEYNYIIINKFLIDYDYIINN